MTDQTAKESLVITEEPDGSVTVKLVRNGKTYRANIFPDTGPSELPHVDDDTTLTQPTDPELYHKLRAHQAAQDDSLEGRCTRLIIEVLCVNNVFFSHLFAAYLRGRYRPSAAPGTEEYVAAKTIFTKSWLEVARLLQEK